MRDMEPGYHEKRGGQPAGPAPEESRNVLVCLSSSSSNSRVIHTAVRLAAVFGGELTALFVETPAYARLPREDKDRLQANMDLARKKGAKLETVVGDDVPYQIAEFARLAGISHVVIGLTNTPPRLLPGRKSFTDRLISYAPDLDYFIIPDKDTKVYVPKAAASADRKQIAADIGISLLALVFCTFIGFIFSHLGFTDANIIMVYLLGLLAVSMASSHRACSLIWAVVSVLVFDLLFTTPRFSFYAYGTGYPVTFLVMFAAAFLISSLAIRLKGSARQSARSAGRMRVVLETDRQLSKAKTEEDILQVLVLQLQKLLHRSIVVYEAGEKGLSEPAFYPAPDDDIPYPAQEERPAACWAYENQKRSGASTKHYPDAGYLYYCMRIHQHAYGVVGIAIYGNPPDASAESMLLSVIGECCLALENAHIAREKEETLILAENERLRANLLRSISHDLRTPLTSISGNADNLLSGGDSFDEQTRRRLYQDIYEDARWLTGMVENLLSASRIEEGRVNLQMTPELIDDIIREALSHLGRRGDHHRIVYRENEDLLLVRADARLIVQLVTNLLDNAMKYTPAGSEILIRTFRQEGMVHLQIADDGPGIPDEHKDHIFDRFYTGREGRADSRRGLGLGLSLCRSIVQAHQGRICVHDNNPHGAVFDVALPEARIEIKEESCGNPL